MSDYKPRILVVDDEKFNRTVLTDLLKDEYTVVLAKDGQQALQKAHSEHTPDLILLDIMMEEMDGYTACQRLKDSPITRDIPIIFVTARKDAEDERKGLSLGAIDYISKPFSPAIVLARVRNHLALSQALQKLADAHTMLAIKNKELEALASKDALTGVRNRFSLDEAMAREVKKCHRYNRSLALLLIDVDHFKSVNDFHGHLAGDQVLREIATLLKNNVRRADIVGRWGGEEFLIICPETNAQGGTILGESLRQKIEQHTFSFVQTITASFGLAIYEQGDTVQTLIHRVDEGLYKAKGAGRNTLVSILKDSA